MKTVITYGTFDLFHIGHLNILKRAKELGDYLIVAVSSDEFNLQKGKVCQIKDTDRMQIVEAIRYVDKVIPETSWDQKIEDVKKYNVDVNKACIASLMHDYCKYDNPKDLEKYFTQEEILECRKYPFLYHAYGSSYKYKELVGDDEEIFSAIYNHVFGKENMTMLEKIIYASDYLEPTRNIPAADKIREKIFTDFDNAFLEVVLESINFVLSKKQYLSDKTIELYNSLVIK